MFNKIKDSLKNFKVGFLYFLIKAFMLKEDRELFLKWIEMKEDIITEYDFNLWVTKNILNPEEE
ncbi:hypothetical protein LCGC14_2505300 [marine sediment metagenome]|uniref:Uncharacterized protein n=1 Tax=marine sediment metagenome TaxID=412755 RepID=A0A0F9DU98_9ZZZZ